MANSDVPIPGSPLIFFFFITLGFLIFTLFSIQNAKSIDDIEKAKDGSLLTIIYVCVLIIGSYFINSTVSKAICNSEAVRWSNILLATLLPWIIIFFSLFIVLKIFPGWITPFSNTVGYVVISILGVENTLTAILNKDTNNSSDLAKAIANITHNKSNFINQIDINKATFLSFIGDLKKVGIITLKNPEGAGTARTATIEAGTATTAAGTTTGTATTTAGGATRGTATRGGATRGGTVPGPTGAGAIAGGTGPVTTTAAPITGAATPGAAATAATAPATAATPGPAGTATGTQAAAAANKELERELLTNPDIQNLYKLLVIKNVLGQITWYTLAGVLVSSVSYNYIINMSCDKSLEEITTELNNAEAASLDYAQRNG